MWLPILVGIAAGLLVAMFLLMKQERGYRLLFSDTHLIDLGKCVVAARGKAPQRTFEGVTVSWEVLPEHVAVTLALERALAPAAARFLLAYVLELTSRTPQVACLQLDRRRFAIVWETRVLGERAPAAPDESALPQLRAAAADAMKQLPLTEGQLAAYR